MKKLLLSTILVTSVAAPAMAQSTDTDAMFRSETDPTEIHASNFIGMRVYRADQADQDAYEGAQQDWDDIGEINDVIMTRDGEVDAVLVDIGGFLGIGENQVAVKMDSIKFVSDSATAEDENDFFLVLNAPADSLENAPAYGREETAQADVSDTAATPTADSQDTASADQAPQAETGDSAGGDQMASDDASATNAADGDQMASDDTSAEKAAEGDQMASEDASAEQAAEGDQMASEDQTGVEATEDQAAAADTTATDPAAGTGGIGAAPLMRDGYLAAEQVDLTAERLTGAPVFDTEDKRIGEVSELILNDDGQVRSAVVDVGGFLGIGEKPVELNLEDLDIMKAEDSMNIRVYVPMTEDEMEAMPEYQG